MTICKTKWGDPEKKQMNTNGYLDSQPDIRVTAYFKPFDIAIADNSFLLKNK